MTRLLHKIMFYQLKNLEYHLQKGELLHFDIMYKYNDIQHLVHRLLEHFCMHSAVQKNILLSG